MSSETQFFHFFLNPRNLSSHLHLTTTWVVPRQWNVYFVRNLQSERYMLLRTSLQDSFVFLNRNTKTRPVRVIVIPSTNQQSVVLQTYKEKTTKNLIKPSHQSIHQRFPLWAVDIWLLVWYDEELSSILSPLLKSVLTQSFICFKINTGQVNIFVMMNNEIYWSHWVLLNW